MSDPISTEELIKTNQHLKRIEPEFLRKDERTIIKLSDRLQSLQTAVDEAVEELESPSDFPRQQIGRALSKLKEASDE